MRVSVFRALLLGVTMCAARAQEGAEISGYIRDSTQSVIVGADVSIFNEQTGFLYRVESGKAGLYEVPHLFPGVYKITVRKLGFRTHVRFGVKLQSGHAARLDFEMQVGDMHEVILVTDGLPLLNTQDGSIGTRIGREWIERLPLNGRTFANLVAFAPGSVITPATMGEAGQFSVNGQRPNTHYFSVDGVSANLALSGAGVPAQVPGASLPTMTAFGSLHSLVPLEALNEFDLRTSTMPPELGRSPGGQLALESRSGSNEWHGTLSASIRNEALDANDWFANRSNTPRSPLRMVDGAATVGGPLRRDATFIFAAYEKLRLRQPYTWRSAVPSLDARQARFTSVEQLLSAFPVPNGPDLGDGTAEWAGSSSRPANLNSGSLRLDHAFNDWLRIFGRYSHSTSEAEFGSLQINNIELRPRSITIGLTTTRGPRNVNEFRVNRSRTDASSTWQAASGTDYLNCYVNVATFGPNTPCESHSRIAIGGLGQLIAGAGGPNQQQQWQVVNTTTMIRGSHQVRLGADYRQLAPRRQDGATTVTLSSPSLADALNARFRATIMSVNPVTSPLRTGVLYLQDTWKATPRLTLNGGFRWEFHPGPTVPVPANSFLFPFVDSPNNDVRSAWSMRYASFAPRLGLALLLSSDGRTVFRSGLGRSFAPDFGVAVDGINGGPYNIWQFNQGVPYQSHPPLSPPVLLAPGYAVDLRVPSVWQWTTTIERAWTNSDVVSLGYVGSGSNTLLRRERAPSGSNTLQTIEATNHGRSSYHSLQAQYRRRMSAGLQFLASYTWSHSIDNGSADSALYWYRSQGSSRVGRGPSDFDVRHAGTVVSTYIFPERRGIAALLGSWILNGMLQMRTGFPIDVLNSESALGTSYTDIIRPDRVAAVPIWLTHTDAPGGRRLNRDAFHATGKQGDLGRNALRGFGMTQVDLALSRGVRVTDAGSLEFRVEVFNAFNHPNFADPSRFLDSPLFGESVSMLNLRLGSGTPGTGAIPILQTGGPRSVQLMLRLHF